MPCESLMNLQRITSGIYNDFTNSTCICGVYNNIPVCECCSMRTIAPPPAARASNLRPGRVSHRIPTQHALPERGNIRLAPTRLADSNAREGPVSITQDSCFDYSRFLFRLLKIHVSITQRDCVTMIGTNVPSLVGYDTYVCRSYRRMPIGVSYKRIDSITDFGAKKEVVLAVEETPDTPVILLFAFILPSLFCCSSIPCFHPGDAQHTTYLKKENTLPVDIHSVDICVLVRI